MDKTKSNKIFIFLLLFSTILNTALNLNPAAAETSPEFTKIAVILPLSGTFAEYGKALQQGYKQVFTEAAAENRLAAHYKIEYFDSKADPETTRTLINTLSAEGNTAIATGTPLNATAWTAAKACEKNGLPYLITGADQDNLIAKNTKFCFRLTQKKSGLEQLLTKYMATRKTKIKSMGIIYRGDSAGAVSQARRIRKLCIHKGIDLTIWKSWKEYSKDRNNFYDLINTIKKHRPQILFLITGPEIANRLWQQGRKLEIMPQKTISIPIRSFSVNPELYPAAQLIYATPWPGSRLDSYSIVTKDASPLFQQFFAQGSAAAQVILGCLQKNRTLAPATVIKSMESLSINTVYGKVRFSNRPSGHQNHLPWYLCRSDSKSNSHIVFSAAGTY